MGDSTKILNNCLYFSVNTLSRVMTKLAEEAFAQTGLSPSHAFLLMSVNENPGISPNELAKKLQIAPSTVTRFVDVLEKKGLVFRESDGKSSKIINTEKGKNLQPLIKSSWNKLHDLYSEKLGERLSGVLNDLINEASHKLD
ncbi:MAG: MarR family transcriptional regulator [Ignavibacteria bacterium GWB2_35_6b]|nr:MAG: MarR family transcriptional regulator [Ignavibacteria bacterium GWB2_35_6b]